MVTDLWFAIAMIEFVILLDVFRQKVVASMKKNREQTKKGTGRQIGKIEEPFVCSRGIAGCGGTVTLFKIQKEGGVFLAGVIGHEEDILEGCTIEFWPSKETVAFENVPRNRDNADGTRSAWIERVAYYGLEKYRIIPDEEILAD